LNGVRWPPACDDPKDLLEITPARVPEEGFGTLESPSVSGPALTPYQKVIYDASYLQHKTAKKSTLTYANTRSSRLKKTKQERSKLSQLCGPSRPTNLHLETYGRMNKKQKRNESSQTWDTIRRTYLNNTSLIAIYLAGIPAYVPIYPRSKAL